MKRKYKRKKDESEINITPMLDIVFIMLIFFIVTTSFVKEISLDVNRPSKTPIKEEKRSEVISIRISKGFGVISNAKFLRNAQRINKKER